MDRLCASGPKAFVRWLHDETFFSLCSRQHRLLGHLDASSTLAWLYGSSHFPVTHDFPGNFSGLRADVKYCWGDVASIINDHTILPLFYAFQSEGQIDSAFKTMESPSIGSLKYRLGLVTGGFGAEHPLKACTACMAEDQSTHGVAYWHLSHQFPGVIQCPIHGLLLRESTVNRQWSGRFRWALPDPQLLEPSKHPESSDITICGFGAAVLELATFGKSSRFDPSIVCAAYGEALKGQGFSRTERTGATASFLEHTLRLQSYTPLNLLPTTQHTAAIFISQMTRKPRSCVHPLKHLTLITWLFGGFSPFIEACERLSCTRAELGSVLTDSNSTSTILSRLKIALPNNQCPARRPKKLKAHIRENIIELLSEGTHKEIACYEFNITVCTVNRILRSEPGLQRLWTEKQLEFNLSLHRTEWIRTVAVWPELSAEKIRKKIPRAYGWLYRNDRIWLMSNTKKMPRGCCGNNSNVDWLQRDKVMIDLITSKLIENHGKLDGLKIKMRDIYMEIPSLFRSLEKRERYPKTRELLAKIIAGS
ncbi:TnsD family transposase [Pseudomonas syringae]|uniref:TnsD family transposase n=1 Tax=Pseudomonas syringae TaxID=317 RepID=UPI00200B8420|nr:TnsD family transposase [Pseudomonas syringae]MCK9707585.1 TnsD family transposase [Pseudomonas syringae pv. syringae]